MIDFYHYQDNRMIRQYYARISHVRYNTQNEGLEFVLMNIERECRFSEQADRRVTCMGMMNREIWLSGGDRLFIHKKQSVGQLQGIGG